MEALGIILMILGAAILRQVAVGRAADIPSDAQDIAVDIFTGKFSEISTVTARRGTTDATTDTDTSAGSTSTGTGLVATMYSLGHGKPYVWGATGPNSYDCSGLVWAAVKKLGKYSGNRFTTSSFEKVAPQFATRVTGDPQVNDIVIWVTHHMGAVSGDDMMYSAYSSKSGIIYSKISANNKVDGKPHYWRLK